MYGIFCNTEKLPNGHEWDYIDFIMNHLKTIETRNKDMLKRIVGERVAIIDRCKYSGAPVVRGFVTITRSAVCRSKATYINMGTAHQVHPASAYYWNDDTKQKVFYFLQEPERAMKFIAGDVIHHGRSYVKFDEEQLIDII